MGPPASGPPSLPPQQMPPSSYPSRSGPPPPADPRGPHVSRTGTQPTLQLQYCTATN